MKTYNEWQKSNLNLDKYLTEVPCDIDEELCLYLAECTAPNFSGDNGIVQTGEATYEKDDKLHYLTVQFCGNNTYKYLGCLPDMDGDDDDYYEPLYCASCGAIYAEECCCDFDES